MNVRKHYMTLCIYNNTEVTYRNIDKNIEITFEQAYNKGFKELVVDIKGKILKNNGFNDAEVECFLNFLKINKKLIKEEALCA